MKTVYIIKNSKGKEMRRLVDFTSKEVQEQVIELKRKSKFTESYYYHKATATDLLEVEAQ